ncbi:histidine phosphatase family protein [Nocardia sp. NPDC020380]|uniref:histidine phosphatase family protein n=1 Tax=Nocardia sp. NPDC020380 TaxID=3364309 RepID=UPI0037A78EE1
MGLESLTVVRHGESTGNAALAAALRGGAEEFDKGGRDADTPLSERGQMQAGLVGAWLLQRGERATAVYCSPYLRARDTARIALQSVPAPEFRIDERLRDRENGVLGGLTGAGIARRYPVEHRQRERLGPFYYRPPGGESWVDVALRLRTLLPELSGDVLVFAHDIVVVMLRSILEGLDEQAILAIESDRIANGSISRRERAGSEMRRVAYNDTSHLD